MTIRHTVSNESQIRFVADHCFCCRSRVSTPTSLSPSNEHEALETPTSFIEGADCIVMCRAPYVQNRVVLAAFTMYCTTVCVCVCVFSSHPFWTSSSLDVPAGVTQEEGHSGFLIHLPSAVRALIFVARRIQPFLSLVDREVEFCVLTN